MPTGLSLLLPLIACVFWIFILLEKIRSNSYFILILIYVSFFCIISFFAVYIFSQNKAIYYLLPFFILSTLSICPLFYLYVRKLTGKNKWGILCVGSLSIALIFSVLAICLTFAMKKEEFFLFLQKMIYKENVSYAFSIYGKARILLFYVNHSLFFIETVVFPALIIKGLTEYKNDTRHSNLAENEKPPLLRSFRSICIIIITTSLITLTLSIKLLLTGYPSSLLITTTSLIYFILLFWIGVFSLRETRISYKKPNSDLLMGFVDNNVVRRENKSFITEDDRELDSLKFRLIQLFEGNSVFRNQNLKISDVALLLNTNRTYVSNVINNDIGCCFSDFVNYYRVESVKKMLDDPTFNNLTLLEISEKAGFSGSNSFYRIFRKFEHKAPNQYRQEKIKETSLIIK